MTTDSNQPEAAPPPPPPPPPVEGPAIAMGEQSKGADPVAFSEGPEIATVMSYRSDDSYIYKASE